VLSTKLPLAESSLCRRPRRN